MQRFWLLSLLLITTCGSENSSSEGDKEAVVHSTSSLVIMPTLDAMVAATEALTVSVQTYIATPSEQNLQAAKDAWRFARVSLKQSEAFGFGPAATLRTTTLIDQSPITPSKIETELAGSTVFTSDSIEKLGADSKGLHALEYLLFQGATTDGRRQEMMLALAQNIAANTLVLQKAWQESYLASFNEPSSTNQAFSSFKAVIDALVNESVFLSEFIFKNRLTKPMGETSGGTPQPDLEESPYSDNSVTDMLNNLYGMRNIYLGTRDGTIGNGVTQLVIAQSSEIDALVKQAFTQAIADVEAIPRPFKTALLNKDPSLKKAQESVKNLNRTLTTEVVTVLGVTLKFNDNDGD